jgi:hypothetical protein
MYPISPRKIPFAAWLCYDVLQKKSVSKRSVLLCRKIEEMSE